MTERTPSKRLWEERCPLGLHSSVEPTWGYGPTVLMITSDIRMESLPDTEFSVVLAQCILLSLACLWEILNNHLIGDWR